MTRTRWIIFAVICLGILGTLIVMANRDKVNVSDIDDTKIVNSGVIKDHVFGTRAAKATLIEYGDFQCPGCGSLYPILRPLKEHYKNQLTFIFRNYPLTSIHPNALAAATAAEAAGLQGKFFEMHNKLYETQSAWQGASPTERVNIFKQYAVEVGVDSKQFAKDLNSKDVADKIRRDQALAGKAKATGTPTLLLNNEKIENTTWNDSVKFEKKIREIIEESGQELPAPMNKEIKA